MIRLFGIQHECAHEDVHEIIQPDEQFATDPWPNADLIRAYVKNGYMNAPTTTRRFTRKWARLMPI